jgi:hypothetical protein
MPANPTQFQSQNVPTFTQKPTDRLKEKTDDNVQLTGAVDTSLDPTLMPVPLNHRSTIADLRHYGRDSPYVVEGQEIKVNQWFC